MHFTGTLGATQRFSPSLLLNLGLVAMHGASADQMTNSTRTQVNQCTSYRFCTCASPPNATHISINSHNTTCHPALIRCHQQYQTLPAARLLLSITPVHHAAVVHGHCCKQTTGGKCNGTTLGCSLHDSSPSGPCGQQRPVCIGYFWCFWIHCMV